MSDTAEYYVVPVRYDTYDTSADTAVAYNNTTQYTLPEDGTLRFSNGFTIRIEELRVYLQLLQRLTKEHYPEEFL